MAHDFKVGDYVRAVLARDEPEKFCTITRIVESKIYGHWHVKGEKPPKFSTWIDAIWVIWIEHAFSPHEPGGIDELLADWETDDTHAAASCSLEPTETQFLRDSREVIKKMDAERKETKYQQSIFCECKECEREFKAANRELRELKEEIQRLQNEVKHQMGLREDLHKTSANDAKIWKDAHAKAIALNHALEAENTRLKDDLEQLTKINATEGMF